MGRPPFDPFTRIERASAGGQSPTRNTVRDGDHVISTGTFMIFHREPVRPAEDLLFEQGEQN